MGRERSGRAARGRDAAVAIGLAVLAAALLVVAGAEGGGRASRPEHAPRLSSTRPLPPGWHRVDRQLTGVILPVQVFAAATYPIVFQHRPRDCVPSRGALAEMPPGGVLLQVIEYPPRAEDGRPLRVPRLPRRPDRFSYANATWGEYECAGPSYRFTYRQAGHALQAQVWMHRGSVDPVLRAGALRILDHLATVSLRRGR